MGWKSTRLDCAGKASKTRAVHLSLNVFLNLLDWPVQSEVTTLTAWHTRPTTLSETTSEIALHGQGRRKMTNGRIATGTTSEGERVKRKVKGIAIEKQGRHTTPQNRSTTATRDLGHVVAEDQEELAVTDIVKKITPASPWVGALQS